MSKLNGFFRPDRLPYVAYSVSGWELARLAIEIGSNDLLGKTLHTFISLPNLVAGIADLIHKSGEANAICSDDLSELGKILSQLASRATCSSPVWASGSYDSSHDEDIDNESEEGLNETKNDASQPRTQTTLIAIWLDTVKVIEGNIQPSSLLLGKIWTRLYFNLTKITDKHRANLKEDGLSGEKKTDTNAAKIMRFNVIALLHAVLVEEVSYHKANESFKVEQLGDRNNPVESVKLFSDKLKSLFTDDVPIENIKQQLPIFYCLVTCPLLLPFLMAEGSIQKKESKPTSEEKSFEKSVIQLTQSVYGKGFELKYHQLQALNKAVITAAKTDSGKN